MHIWKVRGNRFCSNLVEITYTVYIGIMYATYRTSNSLCHFPSSYSPENLMAYDTVSQSGELASPSPISWGVLIFTTVYLPVYNGLESIGETTGKLETHAWSPPKEGEISCKRLPGVEGRGEQRAVRPQLGYLYEFTVVFVSGPHDLSINCLVCLGMD